MLDGVGPMFLDDKSGSHDSDANPSSATSKEPFIDFDDSIQHVNHAISSPTPQMNSRNNSQDHRVEAQKIINNIRRTVSQILVIYDDQTCETFVPKK